MKLAQYFSFNGRTSRIDYWRLQVPLLLLAGACWCGGFLLAEFTGVDLFTAIGVVAMLPLWGAMIALLFRRLHDRNKSGWWIIPFYLTPLALELIVSQLSGGGENLTGGLIALVGLALALWSFIELGLLKGTPGKNRFGPDPRAA